MKKLLFVCSKNKFRSATAEAIFSEYDGIEAIGCGVNQDAATPLSGDLIEWADIVFVMERQHWNKMSSQYNTHLKEKRMICLGVPDKYEYMHPGLIKLLKARVGKYVHL